MNKSLLNLKVKIIPDLDLNSMEGIIVLANELNMKEIIIKLLTPFNYEGVDYEFLIASSRHEGNSFDKLLQGDGLLCSLMRIPPEQLKSDNPFDTSWWRGGGAFIGDVTPF